MTSRRRRGRPRKTGARHKSGHLKALREPADSPRAIAARMPHRRGLGDKATDQRAETELGRMVLRGELEPVLATAGDTYAWLWRGYVSTLNGPRWPWRGQGRVLACDGCPSPKDRKYCACDLRRRIYLEAIRCLNRLSGLHRMAVVEVAVHDHPIWPGYLDTLRVGLAALAVHFGLTRKGKPAYQNASSQITSH